MTQEADGGRGVQVIGGLKLVKGILLVATAGGLLTLLHKDQAALISKIAHRLSADPNAHYFRMFSEKFMRLSPKLPLLSIGTFFYGALFCVEGVGLLMRKRWAEYLTLIATASFLPIEIYEIIHHATVTKGLVTLLNLVIVGYLFWRIRHKQGRAATTS